MRKSIFCLLFVIVVAVKAEEQKRYPLESVVTNSLSKQQNWEKVNEWIALNFTSYKASVDYKNEQSGKIVVKGIANGKYGSMKSVLLDVLSASVEFTMTIQCEDSCCILQFPNIKCSFESGYGRIDYLPTKTLEECRDEMDIVMIYGPNFTVDKYMEEKFNGIKSEYNTAKSTVENTALKKK